MKNLFKFYIFGVHLMCTMLKSMKRKKINFYVESNPRSL